MKEKDKKKKVCEHDFCTGNNPICKKCFVPKNKKVKAIEKKQIVEIHIFIDQNNQNGAGVALGQMGKPIHYHNGQPCYNDPCFWC